MLDIEYQECLNAQIKMTDPDSFKGLSYVLNNDDAQVPITDEGEISDTKNDGEEDHKSNGSE